MIVLREGGVILIKDFEDKEDIKDFLKLLSKEMNINYSILDTLYKYFKEDIFFIFSLFGKKNVKFLSIEKLKYLKYKIMIKRYLKNLKTLNLKREELLKKIKNKFNLNLNIIIKILEEIENDRKQE